jgi:hypothetical protein
MRIYEHDLIKRLQTEMPRGAPFGLAELQQLGISPQLAAYYVSSGWLQRLGQGVYGFCNDNLSQDSTLIYLQSHIKGLHIAGKSALSAHGVRHNLGIKPVIVLWGDVRVRLPEWFLVRFPARYVYATLFKPSSTDFNLTEASILVPPSAPANLAVSSPERAVLEMLYEVGTHQGLEEARNIFDGLQPLRKELLGKLLCGCTSIKAIRLFLKWARETSLVDVDELLHQFQIPRGSDKRWMTRLPDGTLLSLGPEG